MIRNVSIGAALSIVLAASAPAYAAPPVGKGTAPAATATTRVVPSPAAKPAVQKPKKTSRWRRIGGAFKRALGRAKDSLRRPGAQAAPGPRRR